MEQRRTTNAMGDMDEYTRKLGYILIVDKDPTIRRNVSEYFSDNNIPTSSAPDWSELKRTDAPPSLIVMDQQTGRSGGLDMLRSIRSKSDVSVIMTGNRPDEFDRVVGLELGADDYIVKPFSPRELLARARAILRRRWMASAARADDSQRGGYRFGGWRLERRSRRLVDPNETKVSLSKSEYALLVAFLEVPQQPLTREHLLQATRVHADIFDRSIDVQVLRLRRRKLELVHAPRVIRTERGVGYVFALPVERF
jgi:two-component system, OmpR family, response regulator